MDHCPGCVPATLTGSAKVARSAARRARVAELVQGGRQQAPSGPRSARGWWRASSSAGRRSSRRR
eukprot:5557215-Lingulodinium_polyedra.AAC.1